MNDQQICSVNNLVYRETGKHWRAIERLQRKIETHQYSVPFEWVAKWESQIGYHERMVEHYNSIPLDQQRF